MFTCPMCKKRIDGLDKECPKCRTDLSLLVDYMARIHDGLTRADALTRQGELGAAIWAYLEVLEVDPDCLEAQRQIGPVAAAVRQFDRAAVGRRWLERLRRQRRWRTRVEDFRDRGWFSLSLWLLLVVIALGFGYVLGRQAHSDATTSSPSSESAGP
jgi:hypothetical protein